MELRSKIPVRDLARGEQLIREVDLLVAGRTAYYRLYESAPQFFVEIAFGQECRRLDAGQSFSRAAYLFELLVGGEVTPCTMEDILQDFAAAE